MSEYGLCDGNCQNLIGDAENVCRDVTNTDAEENSDLHYIACLSRLHACSLRRCNHTNCTYKSNDTQMHITAGLDAGCAPYPFCQTIIALLNRQLSNAGSSVTTNPVNIYFVTSTHRATSHEQKIPPKVQSSSSILAQSYWRIRFMCTRHIAENKKCSRQVLRERFAGKIPAARSKAHSPSQLGLLLIG